MIRNNIATYATTVGGGLLVLAGLFGFGFSKFLGLPFSPLLNLVHLVSGMLAIYFGLKNAPLRTVRSFCGALGGFYSLAGMADFVFFGLGHALIHFALGAGFIIVALMQPLPTTLYSPR